MSRDEAVGKQAILHRNLNHFVCDCLCQKIYSPSDVLYLILFFFFLFYLSYLFSSLVPTQYPSPFLSVNLTNLRSDNNLIFIREVPGSHLGLVTCFLRIHRKMLDNA